MRKKLWGMCTTADGAVTVIAIMPLLTLTNRRTRTTRLTLSEWRGESDNGSNAKSTPHYGA